MQHKTYLTIRSISYFSLMEQLKSDSASRGVERALA